MRTRLQCGHGFCKDCLTKMFTSSHDTTLTCPTCSHVSVVGNSVQGLTKNFAMLSLIDDYTDDDDDDDDGTAAARSCGPVIEVVAHPEVKLVRRIGEESGGSGGVEMWDAVVSGGGGGRGCKHRVAVKKVSLREDMDVDGMQGELESLRKASMWCRNVCTFHGVVKMEGSLYLLMDR